MDHAAVQAQHQTRRWVMERAGNACEGSPKFPACRAKEGEEHPDTGKPTTLAVIRIEPGTEDPSRMRVMCSRCVLAFEFPLHRSSNWRQARVEKGNLELFPIEGGK